MAGKIRSSLQMLQPVIRFCAFTAASLFLAGCSGLYEVRLNDRLVYDPFPGEDKDRDALLVDVNLQGCLNEQIEEAGNDKDYASTTSLSCSGSSVKTLEGIENLVDLAQLDLSNNSISDVNDLARLKELRVLSLSNNQIRDIRALYNLPILRIVNLAGNNAIPCRQLDRLEEILGSSLSRPASCQN